MSPLVDCGHWSGYSTGSDAAGEGGSNYLGIEL